MQVKLASTEKDLLKISDTMLQLRDRFDQHSLVVQMRLQQQQGYQVAYVEADDGRVLCVAGFVVATKLAWGKHIYIDDLVTDARYRSSGAGKLLIDWFKAFARENGCGEIHLDSGVQRFRAHRFYLREGFHISSHHFSMAVPDKPSGQ